MREIVTATEINASAERVWELLTDFAAFPQWNPFVRKASGRVEEGAQLELFFQPPGKRGMTIRPVLLRVQPARELRWRGRLGASWLFQGEHVLLIEAVDRGRVRFVQREQFTGLLVPLLWRSFAPATHSGFQEMNRALKELAEGDGLTRGRCSSPLAP
jgi:hypothetical protein